MISEREARVMQSYLTEDGFVDVPRVVREGVEHDLFPGLLQNVREIRQRDFPLFDEFGRVYLDSAATTQTPKTVKERMFEYRMTHIRGSSHSKNSVEAREAQTRFDEAREKLKCFFNTDDYIVGFNSGTTDASNFVATRFPFEKGDLLLLTEMEHNSQILTSGNYAKKAGADMEYVPITSPEGRLDLKKFEEIVSKRKTGKVLLNLVHVSNVTGVVNPVKKIRKIMEDALGDRGFIYLDMAQSAGHMPIDLHELDVDFAGVSAHKMYGPMGVGGIFVNKRSEECIGNEISGGSAIKMVSKQSSVPADSHERFESGTQDIEGAIEWGFALDYLTEIGMEKIEAHDRELGKYFVEELMKIPGVRVYGPKSFEDKMAVVTFNIGSFLRKNYDQVARKLDERGISVRDGCFCTHIYVSKLLGIPELFQNARTKLMNMGVSEHSLKLSGAVRASFAFYNTLEDAYKVVVEIKNISHKSYIN